MIHFLSRSSSIRKSLAFIMMLMVTLCALAKGPNYKRIAEEAEIVNKACPIKLDDYTVLNNVTADKDTIVYNYTVTGINKTQFEVLVPQIRVAALVQVKNNEAARKDLLKIGARAEYYYYDSDGELLGNFAIENEEWK